MGEKNKQTYLQIDLAGKEADLWKKLRFRLIEVLVSTLEMVVPVLDDTILKQEFMAYSKAYKDHRSCAMENENPLVLAEVVEKFQIAKKASAEFRNLNAEAREKELNNIIKSLRLILGLSKVLQTGHSGEEHFLFIKQVDPLLDFLETMKNETK